MKRLRVALLWFACALSASAVADEAVFPPGSRIGLVPPKHMVVSKRFLGFEDAQQGNAVTLLEMPPEAFEELSKGFTPENLKAQAVEVKSREELKIADRNALLVTGDQTSPGATVRKWLLAVEDPGMTAFVIAQAFADRGALTDEEMRAALISLRFRPPLTLDEQVAALPFRIPERAGFRVVRVITGNSVILTDGPKDIVQGAEQPIVIVAHAPGSAPQSAQRDAFARSILVSNTIFNDISVERAQTFRQKGSDWHEIVARAKEAASGQPVVLTQTIRFARDGYLRMLGVVRADARDEALPRFRSMFDSVDANSGDQ